MLRFLRLRSDDTWLTIGLEVAVGMGIFILALQGLAVAALLNAPALIILLSTGALQAGHELWRHRLESKTQPATAHRAIPYGTILVAIVAASTLLRPLSPPRGWDELMYHLPHARQWALSGELTVNDWLRYAWSPYNFNLLFAAALVLYDDLLAHLLHAFAGWMVALLIFRTGWGYGNRLTAYAATLIWLLATRNEYATAYIDMGITLFIFSACIAAKLWTDQPADRRWLWISCFLLGVGSGAKYQALAFLPFFLVILLRHDRRLSTVSIAAAIFLLPCIYWFARNAILTGDPFNPLGAKLFGETSWNQSDFAYQFADLKRAANWPVWTFWPALLAPLLAPLRRHPDFRGAAAFSIYAVAVWWATSHYDRYLMTAYPVLALMSGMVLHFAWAKVAGVGERWAGRPQKSLATTVLVIAIALTFLANLRHIKTGWVRIVTTPEGRASFLAGEVNGYRLMQQARQFTGARIYQWGLEGVIYYGPNPIWGDHFGRWRYRDLVGLDSRQLMLKLVSEDFDMLLVHSATVPSLERQADFARYFHQVLSADGHKAYKIVKTDP